MRNERAQHLWKKQLHNSLELMNFWREIITLLLKQAAGDLFAERSSCNPGCQITSLWSELAMV